MSCGKLSRLFNDLRKKLRSPVLISDIQTETKITESLEKSGIGILQSNPSLLLTLNSNVTRFVLSEPNLPTQTCIGFYNFLQRFEFKPDLTGGSDSVTLSHRLYTVRKFRRICSLLNSVVIDGFYERPVESLGIAMVDCGFLAMKSFSFWRSCSI